MRGLHVTPHLGRPCAFAAGAAAGTLLGLVSLIAFVVVYAHLAGRVFWAVGMLAGLLAFAFSTLVFSAFSIPAGAALAIAGAGLIEIDRAGFWRRQFLNPYATEGYCASCSHSHSPPTA